MNWSPRKRRERGRNKKKYLKNLWLKFLKSCTLKISQNQEYWEIPRKINKKKTTGSHIITKLFKRENIKCSQRRVGEKCITYREIRIRSITDFLLETIQAWRQWNNIFKSLKNKSVNLKLFEKLNCKPSENIFQTWRWAKLLVSPPTLKKLEVVTPVLTRTSWTSWKSRLFLYPSENWGHRAKHHLKIWRETHIQRGTAKICLPGTESTGAINR